VRNADGEYKQAKATVDDLEKKLADAETREAADPNNQDREDEVKRLQEEIDAIDLREARDSLQNLKTNLETEMRRRSTTYNSELRVIEFDNDANKQLARRPIRRATGGMVRSGIGAMAREVM